MKTSLALSCSLSLLGLFACATSDPLGTLVFEDAVREPIALEDELEDPMPTPRVIASGEHGDLVLLDGLTGAPLDRLKLPTEGVVMDVATRPDPASTHGVSHVFALVSPGEEELAQLFAIDWSEGTWGRPERIARFGGETRMVGTSLGAVVMQREDGARWRLARLDKEPVASTPCPLPQSILSVREVDDATAIVSAIALEDDVLVRIDATIGRTEIACQRTPLDVPQPISRSVRGVHTLGRDVIVDARGGMLAFAPLESGVATAGFTTVLIEAATIEDVRPFVFERSAGFLAVTNGPPAIVLVELMASEDGALSVATASQTLLTGTPLEVGSGFTRIAAMHRSHGALVTSAGLTTFALSSGPELIFGETTAFAAPIVALEGAD